MKIKNEQTLLFIRNELSIYSIPYFSQQMESTIEIIVKLAGSMVLIFTLVWVFNSVTGYGEFYDKMLYDDDDDTDLTIKNNNKDNKDDIIHHVSI